MNKDTARKLCELLGVNPDAPVGKTDRATAVAEFFTSQTTTTNNAGNTESPKP